MLAPEVLRTLALPAVCVALPRYEWYVKGHAETQINVPLRHSSGTLPPPSRQTLRTVKAVPTATFVLYGMLYVFKSASGTLPERITLNSNSALPH